MKLVILNDTHCGVRNSSEIFMEYQRRFYEEIFFPYCKDNDITQVLHLGDYYDHRKNINFKALNHNRRIFLDPLRDNGMTMDIIPGNHDVFHKNTNALCSLKELLGYYTSNVNIFMKPTTVSYDGVKINFLPWISKDNYETSMRFIKDNDGILFGHLELEGFEVLKGFNNPHGMSGKLFKHYDTVITGHYHTKSQQGPIRYLGSQMEFTWNDAHDPKHFHVFDTDTGKITPILNPITLFEKVYYNDNTTDYHTVDVSYLENKFVKVIVDSKTNPFMFDKFIDRIADINTHELKIVENFQEFLGENVKTDIESVENTTELMSTYVDSVLTDLDKDKIKVLMNSLYNEAINEEIQ